MNERLLMAFYGDDFTGSTDAMEALYQYGLRTILFLEAPNVEEITSFGKVDCIGVAGTARSMNNKEMTNELTPIFKSFKEMNPEFVHYKVCSTFDSSPEIGSIGLATDIGAEIFNQTSVPILVGAPTLGRYTAFGHHFAKFGKEVFRLDRHPVMSKHPITPMHESDLVEHMTKQTSYSVSNYSVNNIEDAPENYDIPENNYVVYDAVQKEHVTYYGNLLKNNITEKESLFTVGSSGIEYALGDVTDIDEYSDQQESHLKPQPTDKMLVISGSVSEVTNIQLQNAEKEGFTSIRVPVELLGKNELPIDFLSEVITHIENDNKVILFTSRGPDDPTIDETRKHLKSIGVNSHIGNYIAECLGQWIKYIMDNTTITRLVIAGGDTSGYVTSQLGIYAMEVISSIAPGAPLCLAYSNDERFNHIELALKSGQLGGEDYYKNVFQSGE